MRKIIVILVVLGLLAAPVYARLNIRRYTIPSYEGVCVWCRGEKVAFWSLEGNKEKVVLKCVRAPKAFRWGGDGSCSAEKHIRLSVGTKLILTADEGGWFWGLDITHYTPRLIKVHNW